MSKNRVYALVFLLAAVLFLASCSSNSNLPRRASSPSPMSKVWPDYFPITPGTSWTYEITKADGKTERLIVKIGDQPAIQDKTTATAEFYLDGKKTLINVIEINEKGVFSLSKELPGKSHENLVKSELPEMILGFPLEIGKSWTWTGTYGKKDEVMQESKVAGEEEIEVPAGRFRAFRIDTTGTMSASPFKEITWYAPNFGMIMKTHDSIDSNFISVLQEYSPGSNEPQNTEPAKTQTP